MCLTSKLDSDRNIIILDYINDAFLMRQEQSSLASKDATFPEDLTSALRFRQVGGEYRLRIQVLVHWIKYHGRREAKLVNGSYCFLDNSFKGSVAVQGIMGDHPGEGRVEITDESLGLPAKRVLAVITTNDVTQRLRDTLGLASLIST